MDRLDESAFPHEQRYQFIGITIGELMTAVVMSGMVSERTRETDIGMLLVRARQVVNQMVMEEK